MQPEELIPEINVSAIVPTEEEPEQLSCKNSTDPFCECLDDCKNGKAKQMSEEPIIERYSEEASETIEPFQFRPMKNVPGMIPTKVEPIHIPPELMDSSQESLCRTEEKELEKERLNVVQKIEEDLKKRIGTEFITEQGKQENTSMLKNTARFAPDADGILKIEKENLNASNTAPAKAPIKLTLKLGKLDAKKESAAVAESNSSKSNKKLEPCAESLTFRRPVAAGSADSHHTSYKNLMSSIEEKKAHIKKYHKQETEETLAFKNWTETLKATKNDPNKARLLESKIESSKSRLSQIHSNILILENNVKYMIKLAKDEASKMAKKPSAATSRLPLTSCRRKTNDSKNNDNANLVLQNQLEKKYSEILKLKTNPNPTPQASNGRSSRSYTINVKEKQSQVMSFVSLKGHEKDTPNFSRSKITQSKIFSPVEGTPGVAPEHCSKNKSCLKLFQDFGGLTHQPGKDWINRSLCNPKDAVELLIEGYQKIYGEKANKAEKLIDYWKNYVSSKAIITKARNVDSFRENNSKESSRSMQLGSTNDSGDIYIRKQTQLAMWSEKELRQAILKYFN